MGDSDEEMEDDGEFEGESGDEAEMMGDSDDDEEEEEDDDDDALANDALGGGAARTPVAAARPRPLPRVALRRLLWAADTPASGGDGADGGAAASGGAPPAKRGPRRGHLPA